MENVDYESLFLYGLSFMLWYRIELKGNNIDFGWFLWTHYLCTFTKEIFQRQNKTETITVSRSYFWHIQKTVPPRNLDIKFERCNTLAISVPTLWSCLWPSLYSIFVLSKSCLWLYVGCEYLLVSLGRSSGGNSPSSIAATASAASSCCTSLSWARLCFRMVRPSCPSTNCTPTHKQSNVTLTSKAN